MSLTIAESYLQALANASKSQRGFLENSIRFLLCQRILFSVWDLDIALNAIGQPTVTTGDLREFSNHLIAYSTSSHIIQFASTAVRKYFENLLNFRPNENHAFVASCCLKYLCRDSLIYNFPVAGDQEPATQFTCAFHQYACLYWPYHLSRCGHLRLKSPLKELSNEFMMENGATSRAFACWSECAEHGVYGGSDLFRDWKGEYGNTVWDTIGHPPDYIFAAVAWGFEDMVGKRLEQDPNAVNARSYEFNSPLLSIAASCGRPDMTKILLHHHADVHAKNGFYETALMVATRANRVEIVCLLLDHGARPDQIEGGQWGENMSALHEAVREGRHPIVESMLKHNPDVEVKGENGMTSLDLAIDGGYEDITKLLLAKMHTMEKSRKDFCTLATKVRHAVNNKDEQSLATFLEHWPEGQETVLLGQILWVAVQTGNEGVAKLLLRKGADPDSVYHGSSVLYIAASYDRDENPITRERYTMLDLLLRHGANVNAPCECESPKLLLCYACKEGHFGLVRFLVQAGADVNLAAPDGPTPLYEAVYNDEEEIVAYLLQHGADANYIGHPRPRANMLNTPEECTILDIATEDNAEAIMKLLRQHGAVARRTAHAAMAA